MAQAAAEEQVLLLKDQVRARCAAAGFGSIRPTPAFPPAPAAGAAAACVPGAACCRRRSPPLLAPALTLLLRLPAFLPRPQVRSLEEQLQGGSPIRAFRTASTSSYLFSPAGGSPRASRGAGPHSPSAAAAEQGQGHQGALAAALAAAAAGQGGKQLGLQLPRSRSGSGVPPEALMLARSSTGSSVSTPTKRSRALDWLFQTGGSQ
jgi:hypothetical protein